MPWSSWARERDEKLSSSGSWGSRGGSVDGALQGEETRSDMSDDSQDRSELAPAASTFSSRTATSHHASHHASHAPELKALRGRESSSESEEEDDDAATSVSALTSLSTLKGRLSHGLDGLQQEAPTWSARFYEARGTDAAGAAPAAEPPPPDVEAMVETNAATGGPCADEGGSGTDHGAA